jgi:hypothetical protein
MFLPVPFYINVYPHLFKEGRREILGGGGREEKREKGAN